MSRTTTLYFGHLFEKKKSLNFNFKTGMEQNDDPVPLSDSNDVVC